MTGRERTEARERQFLSPRACLADSSQGRRRQEEPCALRTCFQRDVDRIVYSKAFRRLKHKTQVFLEPEGDHYRTRMTHTLEVTRIARTIARALNLNGERVLNEIMPEGFQHNVQSLRVVDVLELEGDGLNLTHEVREGIVCHTGNVKAKTLEGQILWFADRIAYINHDIEDAMRGGIIYPTDIPLYLQQALGYTKTQRINTLVTDVIENSADQDRIQQSEEIGEYMNDLRDFLFQSVYHNPMAKGEEGKAQEMIRSLFAYYQRNPDDLPSDFQDIRARDGVDRAVCDYIAGMTDSYAVEKFEELFIPRAWTVK